MPPPPPRTPTALGVQGTQDGAEPVRVMLVRLKCCEQDPQKLAFVTPVFDLQQRATTVAGRSRVTCDIVVANDMVISRKHAEIRFKEARSRAAHERARALHRRFRTGYTITDTSANGVFLNGVRVQQEDLDLYAGDVIVFAYNDRLRRFMYYVYVQGGDTPKEPYDAAAFVDALAKPAKFNVGPASSPVARAGGARAGDCSPQAGGGDSPTQTLVQVRGARCCANAASAGLRGASLRTCQS